MAQREGERAGGASADPILENDSGVTASLWTGPAPGKTEASRPPLGGDARCDVCVIGAGVAGLSTAYRLAKAGRKVVVVDDGPVAGGESSRTTSFLNKYPDDGLSALSRRHGEQTVAGVVQSFTEAIDFVEQVCRQERIEETFVREPNYLFVSPGSSRGQDYLDKEMEIARRIGFSAASFVDRAPLPGRDTGRALRIEKEGHVHAARYLSGLAAAAERHGAKVHCRSRVSDVTEGKEAQVKTEAGHTVRCDWVVVCTNASIMFPLPELVLVDSREAAYRTHAVALEIGSARVEEAQFEDTADPYHYVRTQRLGGAGGSDRVLLVGGEDVEVGRSGSDDPGRFSRLEEWARQHWPGLGARRHAWSGQVFEPSDGIAFIGKNPGSEQNVLICTGDSGQGFMHGTVGALILADRILGHERPYAGIYDPKRLSPRAALSTVKDVAKAAAQYRDYVTAGEVGDESEIAPGSGAVVRRGLSKLAVYRDEAGKFHRCSAVCTHAGGLVRWNAMEKSWDCPVHGSRFAPEDGRCITSPANGGLKPAE
jgi:glycine/D-amino acid oxidase-like deaminating enzyme/nitrite reductase/ring-hydroxylating ferredoxin subunit